MCPESGEDTVTGNEGCGSYGVCGKGYDVRRLSCGLTHGTEKLCSVITWEELCLLHKDKIEQCDDPDYEDSSERRCKKIESIRVISAGLSDIGDKTTASIKVPRPSMMQ